MAALEEAVVVARVGAQPPDPALHGLVVAALRAQAVVLDAAREAPVAGHLQAHPAGTVGARPQ